VTFKDNGNGTATIAGTPATGTAGTYPITITANNGVGSAATQSFTLTVAAGGAGGIKLVQQTSVDEGIAALSSASLAFPSNNTAGNWIGVGIRVGQPNETITVKDSKGNTYHSATQINQTGDGDTLAIFYAENIAAGANTVTISVSSADTLRFAILEFSGVATSGSIDQAIANQGSNASPNSGSITTTVNGDLLLGAVMTADQETITAGSGFQIVESVPAAPNTKLIIEYQVQGSSGSTSSSATLSSADPWAAGIAAFKP
jgi:Putative Ig domain